jgi:hypothetical protein
MIHRSGTFEYEAEFTRDGFSESDIVLYGADLSGGKIDRLVGHKPMIRFWRDRIVLVASEKANSSTRNVSFAIGDAVPRSARPMTLEDDSAMKLAAIRSAILLGNGDLKMTHWDCTETFCGL